ENMQIKATQTISSSKRPTSIPPKVPPKPVKSPDLPINSDQTILRSQNENISMQVETVIISERREVNLENGNNSMKVETVVLLEKIKGNSSVEMVQETEEIEKNVKNQGSKNGNISSTKVESERKEGNLENENISKKMEPVTFSEK